MRALARCSCQSLPWHEQGGRLWVPACEAVIQFRSIPPLCPLLVVPAKAGTQGFQSLCPWVPAFAGTTDLVCLPEFPDSL